MTLTKKVTRKSADKSVPQSKIHITTELALSQLRHVMKQQNGNDQKVSIRTSE